MKSLRVAVFATCVFVLMSGPLRAHPGPEPHVGSWKHPGGGEPYDAAQHYRDPGSGEIYYRAENDIEQGMGHVRLATGADEVPVSITLGNDLFAVIEKAGGHLVPVLLVDTDGNGRVDRTVYGRVNGRTAQFDSPLLRDRDLRNTYWQIGVKYRQGDTGSEELDGKYLASVASDEAHIAWTGDGLPDVAAAPPALIILKHQADKPFDLEDFIANPERYTEDFDALTRAEDLDDWTLNDDGNRVTTHFEEEDLFIVRTNRGLDLDVEWGDMPLTQYMTEELQVEADDQGCYTSLRSGLRNHDGTVVDVPQRLLYCPGDNLALFDAPDGYQIGVAALGGGEPVEEVEVSTSIRDNVLLYAKEVHPRRPSSRSTGTVSGNIGAGFSDAGADLGDAVRHSVTGTYPHNIHTGQSRYRPSLLTGIPVALGVLLQGRPLDALEAVFEGAASGVEAVANTASAVTNGVVNPVVQASVGNLASPGAADTAGDWIGAVPQVAAKNLPFGERSVDAVNPMSAWNHNRAFVPRYYTRTDTQLNIDRVATILDLVAIQAIRNHNDDHSGPGPDPEDPKDPCKKDPYSCKPKPPKHPPKMKPPKMKPPKMHPPKMHPPKMHPPKMKMPKMRPPKHFGHLKHGKHLEKASHLKHGHHGESVKKVTVVKKTKVVVIKFKDACLRALRAFGW